MVSFYLFASIAAAALRSMLFDMHAPLQLQSPYNCLKKNCLVSFRFVSFSISWEGVPSADGGYTILYYTILVKTGWIFHYQLTLPRFPLRKKEHRYGRKNTATEERTPLRKKEHRYGRKNTATEERTPLRKKEHRYGRKNTNYGDKSRTHDFPALAGVQVTY